MNKIKNFLAIRAMQGLTYVLVRLTIAVLKIKIRRKSLG